MLQHRLLHYRTALFDRLRIATAAVGVDLVLVHGQATPAERSRQDTASLPWAIQVRNRSIRIGGKDVLWQPLPRQARDCDLVVLMQENRLLSNYPWLWGWGPADTRVAFWGHGRNFQSSVPMSLREKWKARFLTKVDWWFAYTELTRNVVRQAGYPEQRITVLNNAIDNSQFASDLTAVGVQDINALRRQIGAASGGVVGIFCGSLYPDKRLELLVEAGALVHAQRPDFRLVVIGDGPKRSMLERAAGEGWLHCVGAKRGVDKAAWFRVAQLCLNPGLVGLHVLDSFVAGTPMITTADALHSPEICYLQNNKNGLICGGTATAYADAVLALIADTEHLADLRAGAQSSAAQYSLDEMVRRFTAGILDCLAQPRLRH